MTSKSLWSDNTVGTVQTRVKVCMELQQAGIPLDLHPGGDLDGLYPDVCVEDLEKDPF